MPDASAPHRSDGGLIPARPEGEPHLTFHALLSDTLHEMDADAAYIPAELDAADLMCEDAVSALRASGGTSLVRPFHHAYLTPISTPAFRSRPTRLDVRS